MSDRVEAASSRFVAPVEREKRLWKPIAARIFGKNGDQQILIRNLSVNGLQATCESALTPGETLTVTFLDGQILECEVRWFRSGMFGARTNKSIDLKSLLS
ncbi:PilZ domain-containing protein [Parasphingorhabdus sp.]|uniref:PilZ domain-containing protein n=1 Tax=Parasphingorhabdus sp. TaxID=2709688 RepID=UPI00326328A0